MSNGFYIKLIPRLKFLSASLRKSQCRGMRMYSLDLGRDYDGHSNLVDDAAVRQYVIARMEEAIVQP